jgi:hypothetical protein
LAQTQALAAEQQKRAEAEQLRAAEQEKRAETERLSRRRLSFLSVALPVAFLGALGAAFYAWTLSNHAKEQAAIAFSRQLAAQAHNLLDAQLDLALLLSVEAVAAYKTKPTVEAWSALLTALQKSPQLSGYLHAHKKMVHSVAFSPDGQTLASGSEDQTIILWDVATRQPRGAPLIGHEGAVFSVAFSPDGQTLASGSADNTVRFWDVASRQPRGASLTGHKYYVTNVVFSPDVNPGLGGWNRWYSHSVGRGQRPTPKGNTHRAPRFSVKRSLQPRRQNPGLGEL